MKRLIALLALSLAFTSAFAHGVDDAPRQALNFNYSTAGREGVGLVRAFDDGHRTVLQFIRMGDHLPTITRADGTPIVYKNMGDYAVLPTVYREVRIYVDDKIATVKSVTASPTQVVQDEAPRSAPTAKPLPTLAPSQKTIIDPYDMAAKYERHGAAHRPQQAPSAPVVASKAPSEVVAPGPTRTSFTVEAAVPAPTPALTVWIAHRGDWLSDTIEAWSKKAGWQPPIWNLHFNNGNKADYAIPSDLTLGGNFSDAAMTLFKAYIGADPTTPMSVKINPDQHVIIVTNAKAD